MSTLILLLLRNSQHFFNRTNTLLAFPHNILTKAIQNKNFSQHETPSFILKEVPYLYHAYFVSPPSLRDNTRDMTNQKEYAHHLSR
ncbi:hypothetical protein BG78_04305 [Bacillus thuringiensis serovar israelensis]|nr:hypothetical protein RBTH_05184 [Bacillus thuringiensis serovar israelensis ATCC 35646]EXL35526.1 hypothetical protein BG78_04305 [Bacillus thuringiensis serovar israelensis]